MRNTYGNQVNYFLHGCYFLWNISFYHLQWRRRSGFAKGFEIILTINLDEVIPHTARKAWITIAKPKPFSKLGRIFGILFKKVDMVKRGA